MKVTNAVCKCGLGYYYNCCLFCSSFKNMADETWQAKFLTNHESAKNGARRQNWQNVYETEMEAKWISRVWLRFFFHSSERFFGLAGPKLFGKEFGIRSSSSTFPSHSSLVNSFELLAAARNFPGNPRFRSGTGRKPGSFCSNHVPTSLGKISLSHLMKKTDASKMISSRHNTILEAGCHLQPVSEINSTLLYKDGLATLSASVVSYRTTKSALAKESIHEKWYLSSVLKSSHPACIPSFSFMYPLSWFLPRPYRGFRKRRRARLRKSARFFGKMYGTFLYAPPFFVTSSPKALTWKHPQKWNRWYVRVQGAKKWALELKVRYIFEHSFGHIDRHPFCHDLSRPGMVETEEARERMARCSEYIKSSKVWGSHAWIKFALSISSFELSLQISLPVHHNAFRDQNMSDAHMLNSFDPY